MYIRWRQGCASITNMSAECGLEFDVNPSVLQRPGGWALSLPRSLHTAKLCRLQLRPLSLKRHSFTKNTQQCAASRCTNLTWLSRSRLRPASCTYSEPFTTAAHTCVVGLPMADQADNASSSSSSAAQPNPQPLSNALQRLTLSKAEKKLIKERYAFWETQPVRQFTDTADQGDGPIDAPKTVADVRKEPYALPDSFAWCELDVADAAQCKEVYELLSHNYVEDDDAMFRFNYSPEFLQWALLPPGTHADWLVGVRVAASGRLVAFISAVPATIRVRAATVPMVEINFLCVHKKLRSKRLAPVLIREITRRVNLKGIWQAAYTAGVVLPRPLATCRYWHRSLNPKKLIEVGFSSLQPRMTMARTIKLFKLDAAPVTPGLRPLVPGDVPGVTQLLNTYLAKYQLAQAFSEEEVAHCLTPRPLVVDAWVVEAPGGGLTDLVSFYTLPSSVLGHREHKEIRAAYMYYTVPGSTPLQQLMNDALILAAGKGYDVFNALDVLQNGEFLKDLKFGIGDGALQYYLYNWRVAGPELAPSDVGLILL